MDGEGLALVAPAHHAVDGGRRAHDPRVGEELGVNLAVSLHAARRRDARRVGAPQQKYPIAQLIEACRAYPGANNARRITFEYAMLKGINDSPAEARALARLVEGIPAKFNLIPFNPWPGTVYTCSPPAAIRRFARILNEAGLSAPIRVPRGRDIMAACGQLKSASLRRRKRAQEMPQRRPRMI